MVFLSTRVIRTVIVARKVILEMMMVLIVMVRIHTRFDIHSSTKTTFYSLVVARVSTAWRNR